MAILGINNPLQLSKTASGPTTSSFLHDIGQAAGHTLNALPGYSTLGSQITNPYVNYLGKPNPGAPTSNSGSHGVLGATAPPNNDYTGQGGSTSGSYGTGAVGDANAVAQYNDNANTVQSAIDRLDPQMQVGIQNILNSYNTQANRAAQQKAESERNYNTNKQNTTTDFLQGRSNVNTSVGNQNASLQNLLGLHGSGNSSAAYFAAPYAAARAGTQQINQLQGTFGKNQQSLDTNWQDYNTEFNNSQDDLNNQRYQQENALKSSIGQQRASLLDQLRQINIQKSVAGGAGYQSAVDAQGGILGQINNLLNNQASLQNQYQNPVLKATDVSYNAPNLDQYRYADQGITDNGTGVQTDTVSPFAYLFGKKDQNGNPIA